MISLIKYRVENITLNLVLWPTTLFRACG